MEKSLVFTGIIIQEDGGFCSLCPELDVVSQGDSAADARAMLLEAVSLYLERCFEDGLPYLRPTPPDADPRNEEPGAVVARFAFKVDVTVNAQVNAHAEAA